jgi:hypothetical protein
MFGQVDANRFDPDPEPHGNTGGAEASSNSGPEPVDPNAELAHCFLRLANLPNYALDRLSRYEATLWRQVAQILFALDALDRRKPQDRGRHFRFGNRPGLPVDEGDNC